MYVIGMPCGDYVFAVGELLFHFRRGLLNIAIICEVDESHRNTKLITCVPYIFSLSIFRRLSTVVDVTCKINLTYRARRILANYIWCITPHHDSTTYHTPFKINGPNAKRVLRNIISELW